MHSTRSKSSLLQTPLNLRLIYAAKYNIDVLSRSVEGKDVKMVKP